MKAVNIEVVGMPLNSHDYLWTQAYPNGYHVSIVAPLQFAEVIMSRMEENLMTQKRQEEIEKMQGIQGA